MDTCVAFSTLVFDSLYERVRIGGDDDAIAEWCFQNGLRPNKSQKRIWNEFARKLGWNDFATEYLTRVKAEDGLQDHSELLTSFSAIDYREGRAGILPNG